MLIREEEINLLIIIGNVFNNIIVLLGTCYIYLQYYDFPLDLYSFFNSKEIRLLKSDQIDAPNEEGRR